ncbi:hypothetical protein HDU86_005921 [Geranomyces michiganensis]|nr:hypothetical protein HDU86_005921 [Geranomyces michiganensis]
MLKRLFMRNRIGSAGIPSPPSSGTKFDQLSPRVIRSSDLHDKAPKISIQNVLLNEYFSPYSYADFFAFLQREHSEENIEFCADVARYRNEALALFPTQNFSHSESHSTLSPILGNTPVASPTCEKPPALAPAVLPADHPLSQHSRALNDRYLHNNSGEEIRLCDRTSTQSSGTTTAQHRGSHSSSATYRNRCSESSGTHESLTSMRYHPHCSNCTTIQESPTPATSSTDDDHAKATPATACAATSTKPTTSFPFSEQFPKHLQEQIELIVCRYLERDSEKELNIPESIRKSIVAQIRERGVMHPDVFAPAIEAATNLMRTSSFPNFLKYAAAHDTSAGRVPRRNSAADRSRLAKCGTVTPPTETRSAMTSV